MSCAFHWGLSCIPFKDLEWFGYYLLVWISTYGCLCPVQDPDIQRMNGYDSWPKVCHKYDTLGFDGPWEYVLYPRWISVVWKYTGLPSPPLFHCRSQSPGGISYRWNAQSKGSRRSHSLTMREKLQRCWVLDLVVFFVKFWVPGHWKLASPPGLLVTINWLILLWPWNSHTKFYLFFAA